MKRLHRDGNPRRDIRLNIEVTLLAIGLIIYFIGGFYIIHLMDVAVKELIMGMVK